MSDNIAVAQPINPTGTTGRTAAQAAAEERRNREPLVFGQATRSISSSTLRVTIATSRICGHAIPGCGSRSMRSSSG